VSDRLDYYSSPAIRLNARRALAMAGKTVNDINLFDFYSCFPSAVEIACRELGIAVNDARGLTLTGGLPFFGGPGNNYSMHAIATLVSKLRAQPTAFGLITANGGYLSKHATGIYSATQVLGEWKREDPARCQAEVDAMPSPQFTETPTGEARVETYTVVHERGVPVRGIVIGRLLADDSRFIANTQGDEQTLAQLLGEEMLNRPGVVGADVNGLNLFTF
jgi:acetyl-CoA C-acetyltransferase